VKEEENTMTKINFMEHPAKWKPKELIINNKVKNNPVTKNIMEQCPDVPIKYVDSGNPQSIAQSSYILSKAEDSMLDKILAGKSVLYVAPASNDTVDTFSLPDDRMICPHFERLKLASNGCFYQCDWCYLKLTYRAVYPFITVRVEYDKIIKQLEKKLGNTQHPVIFNSGELADSLAMEHLTGAAKKFIPWFGNSENGYLFMLTKSDNVDDILDLPHNNHTIIAWSMNDERISRKFEIGAPAFKRRLNASKKVQSAGYPLRIRIDPIVPYDGWRAGYAETVRNIFDTVTPEKITLGTLRFEEGFYRMRNSIFTSGQELSEYLSDMKPMFPPKVLPGKMRPATGKYSFSEEIRIEIFDFVISEIRKYSNCTIALCKESAHVWKSVGLDLSECSCVCQLGFVDMS